jgi:hypothetical protein
MTSAASFQRSRDIDLDLDLVSFQTVKTNIVVKKSYRKSYGWGIGIVGGCLGS